MNLRREATKTIWKTVVFAGAMLGTAACSKKAEPTTPAATDTTNANPTGDDSDDTGTATTDNPCGDGTADPCADNPCRDRGSADPCEGGEGRGFILS
jgi:hypothetical protein